MCIVIELLRKRILELDRYINQYRLLNNENKFKTRFIRRFRNTETFFLTSFFSFFFYSVLSLNYEN